MEGFVEYKPLRTQEQLLEIMATAKADSHDVISPTHQLVKNGKTVGYLSIAGTPMVIMHIESKGVSPRDTFHIINTFENLVQATGAKALIAPVAQTQPAHGLMSHMGYKKLATVDLFVKEF